MPFESTQEIPSSANVCAPTWAPRRDTSKRSWLVMHRNNRSNTSSKLLTAASWREIKKTGILPSAEQIAANVERLKSEQRRDQAKSREQNSLTSEKLSVSQESVVPPVDADVHYPEHVVPEPTLVEEPEPEIGPLWTQDPQLESERRTYTNLTDDEWAEIQPYVEWYRRLDRRKRAFFRLNAQLVTYAIFRDRHDSNTKVEGVLSYQCRFLERTLAEKAGVHVEWPEFKPEVMQTECRTGCFANPISEPKVVDGPPDWLLPVIFPDADPEDADEATGTETSPAPTASTQTRTGHCILSPAGDFASVTTPLLPRSAEPRRRCRWISSSRSCGDGVFVSFM